MPSEQRHPRLYCEALHPQRIGGRSSELSGDCPVSRSGIHPTAGKANARRQPGERVSNLTDKPKLRTSPRDVNKSYGPPELCGWQVAPGVFWIQTTEPRFSRKLEKREDTRRVEL